MASRKLARDLLVSRRRLTSPLTCQYYYQGMSSGIRLVAATRHRSDRSFSILNEFSNKIKGEAERNPDFKESVKQLKEKAEELKGVKEELKVRTKQTSEQLYKRVDGVWTDAEATAKKVSADMKEKLASATEEVKERFGMGNQDATTSTSCSSQHQDHGEEVNDRAHAKNKREETGSTDDASSFFGKYRSGFFFSGSPKVSATFQKLKDTKVVDMAKKGFDIVRDELKGGPTKRKHMEHSPSTSKVEKSTRTDIVIMPSKQSWFSKKWDEVKGKLQGHPMFKRVGDMSEPVVTKGQEIAEDMRERWETSDNPVVHKIQDLNESIFQETDAAASVKEIRRRDPSFSLPDFVAEIQELVKPVLNAYIKGDVETLSKYCSPEVIERCKAEHSAYQSHGIFFDNRILHISDVEVRETKMMGTSPIIILAFQTQQVHCVRDRNGAITEGGKDTIHTVYYAWAMQLVDPEELGEGAIYPVWRLREMQQIGVQALI
ncbi:hypothetical protein MLD38_028053 [Melastoma candidum]|uniref:Uncharacterized protein n=1 Tax=Melastoma candidum TaxID=119954 RepID=A0ACB9MZN3_9MYRT|nr:hypothetical protein MLD38_028053 [Melastoma candidum]